MVKLKKDQLVLFYITESYNGCWVGIRSELKLFNKTFLHRHTSKTFYSKWNSNLKGRIFRIRDMGDTRYCTAFAHVVLAGTSIWALRTLPVPSYDDYKWAYGTFGLHLLKSTLGVFAFGNPEHGKKVRTLYDNASYISIIFGFPCIATQLYLNYRYQAKLAYLHVGFAVIPLVSFVFRKRRGIDWFLDLLLAGNILSVLYLSLIYANYYGIAMSVCYAMNYFVIGSSGRVLDLPAIDLFTHGTCFFNYFAIKALRD